MDGDQKERAGENCRDFTTRWGSFALRVVPKQTGFLQVSFRVAGLNLCGFKQGCNRCSGTTGV